MYDTIIIGGGIIGAFTAEALLRKGKRILLVEQFEPGHVHGSSHGDGRIIRFAYQEPIYVQMAQLAYPAWAQLEARTGKRFVITTGGWDCGAAESPQLAELEANFKQFSIPYERLSAQESQKRFPQFALPAGSEVIYQPDAGVIRASPAVLELWNLIRAGGGAAVTNTRVESFEAHSDSVTVRTASGERYTAASLVIAAGGWARNLLAQSGLDLPLDVTLELVAYFAPSGDVDHRIGAMPVFIDYHADPAFYWIPQVEIPGVKVAWHHTGPTIDPDARADAAGDAEITRRLDELKSYVATRLPHLASHNVVQYLTCLYTNTPDYHFVLDRHPNHANVVIGTGFSGHGFKFAPVTGELLAALVLDETPALPLDTFSINRFAANERLVRRTGA